MRRTKRDQDRKGYLYRRQPGLRRIPACLAMLACIFTALLLTGCGEAEQAGGDEIIELHEPGVGTMTTERAAVRDLYDAVTYEGSVYPYIEEYSFDADRVFGSFSVLLGDEVQKGDVLFSAYDEALDEQIKERQQQVNDLTREYEKFLRKQEEDLSIKRSERKQLQEILDNLEAQKPKETILSEENEEIVNEKFIEWQSEYKKWYGEYSLKEYYIEIGEKELQQKKELYALDYGYYNGLLKDLKEEKRRGVVTSGISGKVVAMPGAVTGEEIGAGVPVMAVGSLEELSIKCEYVAATVVERAQDVYALIGGERYKVIYLESEYRSDYASTTFSIRDEDGRVEAGDYAVLVLVFDCRKDVLTVPAQSVYQEGSDQFVHIVEDGVTVSRKVETGMSDGVYTEILSGLEEGEQVVASVQKAGEKMAVLERTKVQTKYQAAGNLYHPVAAFVCNPVKNGTVRFVEYVAVETSYVEKGDVIAIIQVEGDNAELTRREREVKRAKERLADLEESLDMTREENVERIEDERENIRRQEEKLRNLRSDYAETEIRAEVSGYIGYQMNPSTGQVLAPGEILGYIVDDSVTYLALGESNGNLNYGDVVDIAYPDKQGKESIAQGKVLTVGNLGLSNSLAFSLILVELPQEMQENMQATEMRMYTISFRTMAVTGSYQEEGEAVLVPVDAVTIRNGRTYVDVLEEDGSVTPRGFLAGGKNNEYYWVIDGLTEGMKICWE